MTELQKPPAPPYACDVHTHTLYSGHAYSTIGECVAAAKAAGLELLGSTDHYSSMLHPEPADPRHRLRDFQYFINFSVWPRVWDGLVVMHGAEADIVDLEGHLFGWDLPIIEGITGRAFSRSVSLQQHVWRDLDYVIASIHNAEFTYGASLAQTTNMYVRALEDPKVLILGHPGRSGVPFDVDEVLTCAKELGKLIEINEHSFAAHYGKKAHDTCRRLAERCAAMGVMVSTGTDAHIATDVGHFDTTARMLTEIHFPPELIATRSKDAFLDVLHAAIG